MHFNPLRSGQTTGRRLLAGAVAGALLLGGCGAAAAQLGGSGHSAADLGRVFENDPLIRDTYLAMREHFPNEYREMLQAVTDGNRRGGPDGGRAAMRSFMIRFVAAKAEAIMHAPAGDLQAMSRAQAALMEELQRSDIPFCASIINSGEPPHVPAQPIMALLNRLNVIQIAAARHGELAPVEHGPATEADMAAIVARLEADDPALAELIFSGGIDQAAPARRCAAGGALVRAAAAMPPETSARFMVTMVQAAMASPTVTSVTAR